MFQALGDDEMDGAFMVFPKIHYGIVVEVIVCLSDLHLQGTYNDHER